MDEANAYIAVAALAACAMDLVATASATLSIMGLIIATGFVVGAAIPVIENVVRHTESGVPGFQAATQASSTRNTASARMAMRDYSASTMWLKSLGAIGRLNGHRGTWWYLRGSVGLRQAPMARCPLRETP